MIASSRKQIIHYELVAAVKVKNCQDSHKEGWDGSEQASQIREVIQGRVYLPMILLIVEVQLKSDRIMKSILVGQLSIRFLFMLKALFIFCGEMRPVEKVVIQLHACALYCVHVLDAWARWNWEPHSVHAQKDFFFVGELRLHKSFAIRRDVKILCL